MNTGANRHKGKETVTFADYKTRVSYLMDCPAKWFSKWERNFIGRMYLKNFCYSGNEKIDIERLYFYAYAKARD